ncbi:2'-5' RNA ligase family protein [Paenibacillus spiritus]|uniref:2'-5' RNA ligase family protein n=1 Tax=Paenibacillus spiritus TaxID=2496557 RepID=A0A5J5GBJ8_9BACL|nr:2'-5' RNA ligase family protein [Paenibacillus spiritus]KAA9005398.1 2'-5' RNA ligase family protein [Paenibacillus spiritus]
MKPVAEFHNAHIILDMPSPAAEEIKRIRERLRDEFRASLPVEITLAGSSGIGVLEPGQDPGEVFSILDAIGAETAPITGAFGSVLRFPGTDIFVFTLQEEGPFRLLHQRIADSGLRFQQSPFPYTPHCTLSSCSPVSESEAEEIYRLQVPGEFILDTLSVVSMYVDEAGQARVPVLHQVRLAGAAV